MADCLEVNGRTRVNMQLRAMPPRSGPPHLIPGQVRRLNPDVSHAAAAVGGFLGRLADAWRPAHLRLAGPQLVTERAAPWLVLEQRNGHLNDQAVTSGCASMITAA